MRKRPDIVGKGLTACVTMIDDAMERLRWLWVAVFVLGGHDPVAAGDSQSFHFAHDVGPILARAGCAAAECHGGASGRGGFKLSLFASDPEADYRAITQELDARRIDFIHPAESLFLKKPTRAIKHEGGRLFEVSDLAYQVLLGWIEEGAPWSNGEERELVSLRMEAEDQRVRVLARFTGAEDDEGSERDVTEMAMLESTDSSVAEVSGSGDVTRRGPGEAWILARYANLSARHSVLIPFQEASDELGTLSESAHPLDRAWSERLRSLGLTVSEVAPANALVRRLYLDLLGRPPSPQDVEQFHDLPESQRVASTVDRLLVSEEFSSTWAGHLSRWFEVPIAERDPRNTEKNHERLRAYFLDAVKTEVALDDMAHQILTAPKAQVAWKRFSDPRDRAEFVGRSMLGVRLGCARCHNHPHDRWKQGEHLQFSAFFSDPRPNPTGASMMNSGRFFEPETGREVEPKLLPWGESRAPQGSSREEQVAWLVLDAAKEPFARNLANRAFAQLIGKPLVEAEDDHRLSNPAIHESLLNVLTEAFAESDHDLRALVRFIATSAVYAVSSQPGADNWDTARVRYLARREARRMDMAQYRRSLAFVTGTEERPRALPEESPLAEQLFVLNSGLIQESLAEPGNQVEAIFDFVLDPEAQLRDLYLLVLSRPPSPDEVAAFLPELKAASEVRAWGRELAFALLAGREFGSIR